MVGEDGWKAVVPKPTNTVHSEAPPVGSQPLRGVKPTPGFKAAGLKSRPGSMGALPMAGPMTPIAGMMPPLGTKLGSHFGMRKVGPPKPPTVSVKDRCANGSLTGKLCDRLKVESASIMNPQSTVSSPLLPSVIGIGLGGAVGFAALVVVVWLYIRRKAQGYKPPPLEEEEAGGPSEREVAAKPDGPA
jgi:hypothetical protein